jgi:dihydrofolate reductase
MRSPGRWRIEAGASAGKRSAAFFLIPDATEEFHMRKLIVQTLITLDGYVGGPKDELDWHIITPEVHEIFNAQQRRIGGYVMGRKTYEVMRAWDEFGGKPDDPPEYRGFHEDWLKLPKLVFSGTLREVGLNASIATGDAITEIEALKQGDGAPIALNGTALLASIAAANLVDEYLLFVHPVLLGGGTRLFPVGKRRPLRLLETRIFPGGVVSLRYAAA